MAKRKTQNSSVAVLDEPAAAVAPVEGIGVPIDLIDPSPFNPRQNFDQAELEELASTIRVYGLIQPIAVRPVGRRFEIVAGERRWRAAKLAGLREVLVVVRRLSDRQAREIAITENLQRKDLSSIEEARALAALLEGDDAPTQEQLGRRLGRSQSYVANRLRLLRLPKSIQSLIADGTLPATHARILVPLSDAPALLSRVEAKLFKGKKAADDFGTVDEFEDNLHWAIQQSTEPMEGDAYHAAAGRRVPIFAPTPEQEQKLGVIEFGENGDAQRLATNTKLWTKLQEAHVQRLLKEHPDGKARGKKPKAAAEPKPKTLSPEEERAKAKERARRFAKALWQWKIDWLSRLVAEALSSPDVMATEVIRALLYFAVNRTVPLGRSRRGGVLGGLRAVNEKSAGDWYATACLLNQDKARLVAAAAAAEWFWTERDGPSGMVADKAIVQTAEMLEINLDDAWLRVPESMLRRYFELQPKEHLEAMWEGPELGAGTKAALVDALVATTIALPDEIRKAKQPKNSM